MKPGKAFNLSKTTKRAMATIVDPHMRAAFKREMIQAEIAAAIVPKREPRVQGNANAGYATTNNSATPIAG